MVGGARAVIEAPQLPQAIAAKAKLPHSNTFRLILLFNMIVPFQIDRLATPKLEKVLFNLMAAQIHSQIFRLKPSRPPRFSSKAEFCHFPPVMTVTANGGKVSVELPQGWAAGRVTPAVTSAVVILPRANSGGSCRVMSRLRLFTTSSFFTPSTLSKAAASVSFLKSLAPPKSLMW